jgi:rubrerythrin
VNREELMAIKQAILMEIEGYEFYRMASNNFENPEVKEAFKTLMDEEKMHAKWLEETYEKLEKSESGKFNLSFLETQPKAHIFDWHKLMRQSAQSPLSVFGIALELEKSSIDYYSKLRQETEKDHLKALYDILIKWEETHYRQFDELYKELKDEWWSTQGFAPF